MRVALISEHASPLAALGGDDAGGQNTHVAALAAALVDQGHDVRVFTRRDSLALPDEVTTAAGFTVVHVPAGPAAPVPRDDLLAHMGGFGRWLAGAWREWEPDVAHAHFWMSGVAAMLAHRVTGVPVVQTFHALGLVKRRHQGVADTSPPQRISVERQLGCTVAQVVAQCHDEVAELRRLGVPAGQICLIPSGVDCRRFCPDGPVADRGPRGRILAVGRLVERKGFADLVHALASVPEAECVLVGGPPEAELVDHPVARRLWQLADSHQVSDRFRLVGSVPPTEMGRWYRSADVVAATPWYEPFGLVPLEAMACGVPVVATAVGGLTDTVAHDVTGQLVPPRDPRALAAALSQLLADEPRRERYATAAVDRARRIFSWQRTAERLGDVYAAATRRVSEVVR